MIMEPTKDSPTKKPRRWLIWASILFLVSLCSWWYWPGPNAAYVGWWELADGSGEQFQLKMDGTDTYGNHWWIRGNEMVQVRTSATSPIWRFRDVFMAKLFSKSTSTSVLIRFVVTEISETTWTVLAPNQKHYRYRRIPERPHPITPEPEQGTNRSHDALVNGSTLAACRREVRRARNEVRDSTSLTTPS